MSSECWTMRYAPTRLPPAPLNLRAPLARLWKHKPKGVAPGFVRTGFGAIFSTAGKGRPSRLDLETGRVLWTADQTAALITRWRTEVLVFGDSHTRGIEPASGEVKWEREVQAGVQTSFVIDDLLVGDLAEQSHVIDLSTFACLWKIPELVSNPLVSDGTILIRADESVTCFELRTGKVLWSRLGSEFGGGCWQLGFIWRDLFVVKIGEPLLLTAFEVKTGQTVWRTDFPVQWCEPYGERAYGIEAKGAYKILDIATGKIVFEKAVPDVPPPVGEKKGLTVQRDPDVWPWRDARLAVSESHVFVQKPSGQIVVVERATGAVEQVVEIDGMPVGRTAPIIYENRLLLTDFNASVYCFEGAP